MPATLTDRLNGLQTSVAVKAPCRTVSTTNITLAALQTINSVVLAEGDRVLVKGQADASENGIYNASTGDWTRAKDFDGNRDVVQGTIVPVVSGTAGANLYEVTTSGPITIGTTSIAFSLRYGANISYDQTEKEAAESIIPLNLYIPSIVYTSVVRHGAALDGVTADNTALLNAIKSADVIYIPPGAGGILLSAATLTIAAAYAKRRIIGAGRSSIILADAATYNLFTVQADDISFENLAFHGVASSDATGQYGIFTATANAAQRLRVLDCYFGGSSSSSRLNNGIKYDGSCDDGLVRGCIFDEMQGTSSGTGYGVLTGEVEGLQILGNKAFGNVAGSRGRHGFYVGAGAAYCIVANNFTRDITHQHIACNTASSQSASSYNQFVNNTCKGGMTNSSAGQIAIFGKATGNVIKGNTLIDSGENGILLNNRFNDATDNDSLDNEVIENTIHGCGTIGIDVWGTTRTVIRGNKIHNVSVDSSGISPAIRLRASAASGQACTDASVIGNTVTGTGHRAALQFNATSPVSTGTRIRGNSFAPGTTATIENATSATSYDAPKGGTGTIASGATSAVITHLLGITPTLDQISVTLGENPSNTPGAIWVDTITSTQFTVNCESDPGASNLDFAWRFFPDG